jgi:predicted outer membrane repeat protein
MYVMTLLSVGWDPVVSRMVTFSSGGRDFTVNQDQFGDNNGIRVDYTFVAGATTRTITIKPQDPGYTFHLYGLALRQAIMVTHTGNAGAGSLRDAATTAASRPGEDAIAFDSALSGATITLPSEIEVTDTSSVSVDAGMLSGRVTISQSGGHGHFRFGSGTRVSLRGLTFVKGIPTNGENGGSIFNFGALTLTDCTFSGNSAQSGGAIASVPLPPANNGSLTLTDCTFTANTAVEGAAISNYGPMTLTRCAFSGNSATANFSGLRGGAVFHQYGPLLITQCTFSGNYTKGKGGGIFISQINDADNSRNPATLIHCTFSGNTALEAGGGIYFHNFLGFMTLTDSIVSGNTSPAGDVGFRGTLVRSGTNIIQSAVAIENGVSSGSAALTGDPLLAPMGNYGGLTPTMALRPGSPARNAATGPAITADQRGFPLVGLPDIGACEAGTLTDCMAKLAETQPASVPAVRVGPDGDYDGDGASNLEECKALTDPLNAASVFRIVSAVRNGGTLFVTFTTVPGRKYTLEQSHNPVTGEWSSVGVPAIPGDGSNKLVLVQLPIPAASRWYYRVRATP